MVFAKEYMISLKKNAGIFHHFGKNLGKAFFLIRQILIFGNNSMNDWIVLESAMSVEGQ